jgi:hypothetical protein
MMLTIAYDVQFLLGLILAFISPIIESAFSNLNAAMQVNELRFFAVEHMPMMFLALIFGHVTSVLSRKADHDTLKHRYAALGFTLVAIITVAAIPWFRPQLYLGSDPCYVSDPNSRAYYVNHNNDEKDGIREDGRLSLLPSDRNTLWRY